LKRHPVNFLEIKR